MTPGNKQLAVLMIPLVLSLGLVAGASQRWFPAWVAVAVLLGMAALVPVVAFVPDIRAARQRWLLKRRYRRADLGLCVGCAYDLRGNASGVCPECGTPPGKGGNLGPAARR